MSIIFNKTLAKYCTQTKIDMKKLNTSSRCIFVLILLILRQILFFALISARLHRDLFAKHPLDRRCRCGEALAWFAACAYACKFATLLLSTNGAPACRSSAWDVVRQKAVKRRGPRRSGPSYPRPLACKPAHTHLFASNRHPLFKAPLVFPRHRLKRHSAKIIKGEKPRLAGPDRPGKLGDNNDTLASLNAENPAYLPLFYSSCFLCPLSSLPCLSRSTDPDGPSGFLNLIDRL